MKNCSPRQSAVALGSLVFRRGGYTVRNTTVMSTETAKPAKVAIIGASGTYGEGILARAEDRCQSSCSDAVAAQVPEHQTNDYSR